MINHLSTRIASLGRIVLVATRPLPFPWVQSIKKENNETKKFTHWTNLLIEIEIAPETKINIERELTL